MQLLGGMSPCPDLQTAHVHTLYSTGIYNESVPTDLADIYNACLPNAVVRRIHQRVVPYTIQTTDK